MKPLSIRHLSLVVFLLLLLFTLPFLLFLVKKRQDIRPRALVGAANFILSDDLSTDSANKGADFHVTVSLQLTNASVKLTGVDFMLLYDKTKLAVKQITPYIYSTNASAYFSEAPIVTSGGSFDSAFSFLRVALVAKKPDSSLSSGPVTLANITFTALADGDAVIKFPDDNKYLQVSGIGPIGVLQPSVTAGGPTIIPTITGPRVEISPTTKVPTPGVSGIITSCKTAQGAICVSRTECSSYKGVDWGQLDCPSRRICCVFGSRLPRETGMPDISDIPLPSGFPVDH